MEKETYNGWCNYATWQASLWLNNEQCLYDNFQKVLDQPKGRIADTRAIVSEGIKQGIITDKIDLKAVNWEEIIDTELEALDTFSGKYNRA